jgi:hypothetical protein
MNDRSDPKREQARHLALDAVSETLPEQHDYQAELETEEADVWVFRIAPESRVRGCGARVIVTRKDGKVVETIFLQ